jgi:hypothetical protein
MTQHTRRTSGAATGIKSGPRRIPAYQGRDSAGKIFSDVGIGLMRFVIDTPALVPATKFDCSVRRGRCIPGTINRHLWKAAIAVILANGVLTS